MPKILPNPTPEPREVPMAMPKAMPQAVPKAMPQAVPKAMPQAMPKEMPKAMPQAMPKEMPQAMPQAMQKAESTLAETIEITHPQSIFPHIEPYPETSPKQHHFRFKHKSEHTRLINVWSPIQIEFNQGNSNVDLTLIQDGQSVGKIQFLHFDRRDRSNRSKYYVKLYLYQFQDRALFEKAKQVMTSFFQSIHSHRLVKQSVKQSVKRSSRRSIRKHSTHRKHRTHRKN